jgi:hypothetical protein
MATEQQSPVSFLASPTDSSPTSSVTPSAHSIKAQQAEETSWKWWKKQGQVRIRVKIPSKQQTEEEFEKERAEDESESDCGCCHCGCDDMSNSSMSGDFSGAEEEVGEVDVKQNIMSSKGPAGTETGDRPWTLVTPKRKKTSTSRSKKLKRRNQVSSGQDTSPSSPSSPVSPGSTDRALRRISNARSTLASQLSLSPSDLFRKISFIRDQPLVIDRVVMVGLGNLDDSARREPYRAAMQLALLLAVLRGLELVSDGTQDAAVPRITVPCFAQDPAFTSNDVSVLEHFGITTVPIPQGSDMISPTTLVFSPYVDVTVLMPEILGGKSPIMYVGVGFDAFMDGIGSDPLVYARG